MAQDSLNELMVVGQTTGAKISAEQIEGTLYRSDSLGRGAFRVGATAVAATDFTVNAGKTASSRVTVTFHGVGRTIPDLLFSLYVDNNLNDDWIWPDGGTASPPVGLVGAEASNPTIPRISIIEDHDRGYFNGGKYVYVVFIENRSSSSQHYYLRFRWLIPLSDGGVS